MGIYLIPIRVKQCRHLYRNWTIHRKMSKNIHKHMILYLSTSLNFLGYALCLNLSQQLIK